jgi:DNA-binding NarL/FixJ family response regulator
MSRMPCAEEAMVAVERGRLVIRSRLVPELTPRQAEIVKMLGLGMKHAAIAAELGITTHGLGQPIAEIYRRTGCRCVADVARLAIKRGVITLNGPSSMGSDFKK